jgi:hypothetical protein
MEIKFIKSDSTEIDLMSGDFIVSAFRPSQSQISEKTIRQGESEIVTDVSYSTATQKIALIIKDNVDDNLALLNNILREAILSSQGRLKDKTYLFYNADDAPLDPEDEYDYKEGKMTRIYSGSIELSDNFMKYEYTNNTVKVFITLTTDFLWRSTKFKTIDLAHPYRVTTSTQIVDNYQDTTDTKANFVSLIHPASTDYKSSFDETAYLNITNEELSEYDIKKIVIFEDNNSSLSADNEPTLDASDLDSTIKIDVADFEGGTVDSTIADSRFLGGVAYTKDLSPTFQYQTIFTKQLNLSYANKFMGGNFRIYLASEPTSEQLNKNTKFRWKFGNENTFIITDWFYLTDANYHYAGLVKMGNTLAPESSFYISLEAKTLAETDSVLVDYIEVFPTDSILELDVFNSASNLNSIFVDLNEKQAFRVDDLGNFYSGYNMKGDLKILPNRKQRFYFLIFSKKVTGETYSLYKRLNHSLNINITAIKRYII